MEKVLQPVLRKYVMVYIDDIIIYSDCEKDHVQHLNTVFTLLQDANLKLGYDKCDLFCTEI